MSDSKRKALIAIADELKKTRDSLGKAKDELPKGPDTGGLPSEVKGYEGLTYRQVIEKALAGEKEAIFLGLYAIELATSKADIKNLIDITNDENDHSVKYQAMLDGLDAQK
jgi:hypothetical protein